jgi:uncharacterized protein YydD (DUF2326 family)
LILIIYFFKSNKKKKNKPVTFAAGVNRVLSGKERGRKETRSFGVW